MSIVIQMPRASISTAPHQASDVAFPERFEDDVTVVLKNLRGAFGRLLESLPTPPKGGGDVQRALNIDKALGWQLFRIGSVANPITAGPDVPRPVPMAKALRAAAAKGVPAEVVAEAKGAFSEFERLVERHAGSRRAFDSMARGLRQDSSLISMKDRRAAYRANTAIWGVQVRTRYNLAIYHPSEDGKFEDLVAIGGEIGLRRLRVGGPDYGLIAGRFVRGTTHDGSIETTPEPRRTIDVLEEFSTRPLPPLHMSEVEPGMMMGRFESDLLGRTGELTYFVRDVARAVSISHRVRWAGGLGVRMPAETVVVDLLIPAGLSVPSTAAVEVHCNLLDQAKFRRESDLLPIPEAVSHLGTDIALMRTPEVPRCPELVSQVLENVGWDTTRFDIYRCVMQYPILSSSVRIRVAGTDFPG